jgi:hypothetical protein
MQWPLTPQSHDSYLFIILTSQISGQRFHELAFHGRVDFQNVGILKAGPDVTK